MTAVFGFFVAHNLQNCIHLVICNPHWNMRNATQNVYMAWHPQRNLFGFPVTWQTGRTHSELSTRTKNDSSNLRRLRPVVQRGNIVSLQYRRLLKMRHFYSTAREIAERYNLPSALIKNSNGKVLTSCNDQMNKWVEYFEKLLNRPVSLDNSSSPSPLPKISCMYNWSWISSSSS